MEKQSLSQQTTQRLYNKIVVEKQFAPGEKLPNELELAQQLNVSRATLREAIHALTTQRILEVHRGRGTYVSHRVEQMEDFGFSALDLVRGQLRDLFELRSIFEPQAARLACQRGTEDEIAGIMAMGAEVERCILEKQDRTQADRAFHAAIVRATHNEFMMRLLPTINQAVETAIGTGAKEEVLAQITLRDHALLMEFFSRRDGEGAQHAMAIHMRHAMDEMDLEQ